MIFWNSQFVAFYFLVVIRGPYVLCIIRLWAPSDAADYFRTIGIACALAACSAFFEGLLAFFSLMDVLFLGNSRDQTLFLFLALSFVGNFIAAIRAYSIAWGPDTLDTHKDAFLKGAVMGISYGAIVVLLQQGGESLFLRNIKKTNEESKAAAIIVKSISWCALQYQTEHLQAGYPADLAVLDSGKTCKQPWSLSAVPSYKVIYTPLRDNSGRISGFTVKAKAPASLARYGDDAEGDDSGDIYVVPNDKCCQKRLLDPSGIEIISRPHGLHDCITGFAEDNPGVGFPPHLRGVNECPGSDIWYSENSFQYEGYRIYYSPGPPGESGQRTTFHLEAVCKDYAQTCLVSFYTDEGGDVHRTAARRAATVQDPLLRK